MTGYNYHLGMSNNAVAAYDSGMAPLSKITLADLREAGWTGTKSDALRLAKSGKWLPAEWHHSGGTWYNKVDFYCPATLVEKWDEMDENERAAALANPVSGAVVEQRVKGSFALWGGSRRRPRLIGRQEFTGVLRDGWIHLDGGGRKKATGNHIEYEVI